MLAATVGRSRPPALLLYLLVQQVENNLLVPKIQGDAVELHPAIVMSAIIIGGSLAGLLGAILALPVTAADRDVVRYLFRRTCRRTKDGGHPASPTPTGTESGAMPGAHAIRTRSSRSTPRRRTR